MRVELCKQSEQPVGAFRIVTGKAVLADSFYGRGFTLFEPLKIGLPGIIVSVLFYLTFGYKLQKRWFDFPDTVPDLPASPQDLTAKKMTWKMWFVLLVTITCIMCFMVGLNMGVIALLGADPDHQRFYYCKGGLSWRQLADGFYCSSLSGIRSRN